MKLVLIFLYSYPPKASYGVASLRRASCTVFSGASCLKLSVNGYSGVHE